MNSFQNDLLALQVVVYIYCIMPSVTTISDEFIRRWEEKVLPPVSGCNLPGIFPEDSCCFCVCGHFVVFKEKLEGI